MLLALMKQHGVEKTVLIQYIGYRWDNRFVADALKQYPQYFRGVCRVDPVDPGSPDRLAQLVEEQRFHGVRLSPAGEASGGRCRRPLLPPLRDPRWRAEGPMPILAASPPMHDHGPAG